MADLEWKEFLDALSAQLDRELKPVKESIEKLAKQVDELRRRFDGAESSRQNLRVELAKASSPMPRRLFTLGLTVVGIAVAGIVLVALQALGVPVADLLDTFAKIWG